MTNQNSKLGETEKIEQGQKPKICGLAIASLVLAIIGVWVQGLLAIASLGMAVIALVRIQKSNGQLTGRPFAISGIAVSLAVILYIAVILVTVPYRRDLASREICSTNLSALGKAMLIYSCGDGPYPTADKWCDFLIEYAEVTEKQFRCPGNRKERCSYAMNPNCEPNSSPDMVLLFETKGGWNLYGGPEILTFENHKGKGCNVLFNDGYVDFVKPEQVGELKWKVEEANSIE